MNENVTKDLKHLAETRGMEPRIEYPFELKNGLRKKAVNIIGIPTDTSFLEFRDTDNNLASLPDKGYLLQRPFQSFSMWKRR